VSHVRVRLPQNGLVWDCPVRALKAHGLTPIDDEPTGAPEVDDVDDGPYDESTSADPVTAEATTRFTTEGVQDGEDC